MECEEEGPSESENWSRRIENLRGLEMVKLFSHCCSCRLTEMVGVQPHAGITNGQQMRGKYWWRLCRCVGQVQLSHDASEAEGLRVCDGRHRDAAALTKREHQAHLSFFVTLSCEGDSTIRIPIQNLLVASE